MSGADKSYWICKGSKKEAHPEEVVDYGKLCPICNRAEDKPPVTPPIFLRKKTILAVITFSVFLAVFIPLFRFISNQFNEAFHKNTRYGISVEYPKSWELRKPSKNYPPSDLTGTKDLFQLLPSSPSKNDYQENILVKIEQVENNSYLDDYVDSQVARINQIGTYKIDSDQKIQVNKQSAREIIYSGNNDEYDLKRRRIILTPKTQDDYFLLVTYTADTNDYEQYLPDVEQVFKSIDLLD